MKKLMQLTLCKKNEKKGYFFRENNFFAHSRNKQLMMMMRNLSDLNDLYNTQDTILLLEIIENRF